MEGAKMVQGTINGYGERAATPTCFFNRNSTLGYTCIQDKQLAEPP